MTQNFNPNHLELRRANPRAQIPRAEPVKKRPPKKRGVIVIALGNSGEEVALRMQMLAWRDGYDMPVLYLNNDLKAPNPIALRAREQEILTVTAEERLVIGGEGNTRDQIRDYPLLVERYERNGLLRNIPVYQTFNRGGRGGHAMPVITSMDIDLNIDSLMNFLRQGLAWQRDGSTGAGRGDSRTRSDLERILKERARKQQLAAEVWTIVLIGGASGSCGNASLQLLPYLVRHLQQDLQVRNYELWGVLLGPKAFTGLTGETLHNFHALVRSLDWMSKFGQRRKYINDLFINTAAPPYERVFVLDDPMLPREKNAVTEAEQHAFFQRAAISLHLLLNTHAWDELAGVEANRPLQPQANDSRLRLYNTINGALAGVDREALIELAGLAKQEALLNGLTKQLT